MSISNCQKRVLSIFLVDKQKIIFYDGDVGKEELEYVPVEGCWRLRLMVIGQKRPPVQDIVPSRKVVLGLRPDAGGPISPDEFLLLAGQIGSQEELRLGVREVAKLPLDLSAVRRALRRSRA